MECKKNLLKEEFFRSPYHAVFLPFDKTRKPWDSNPQTKFATCFQDKLLIRPDDFQKYCREIRRSKNKNAFNDSDMNPRANCGSWNRTSISTFRASRLATRRSRQSTPPRIRTPSDWFEASHAVHHTRRAERLSCRLPVALALFTFHFKRGPGGTRTHA